MEVAFQGISADQIAEMRARLILLDERPTDTAAARGPNRHGPSMLAGFVEGFNSPFQVKSSPLGQLQKAMGADPHFLEVATLYLVAFLVLSGTVEHVLHLEVRALGKGSLGVEFRGQRRRAYSNVEPSIVDVKGTWTPTQS